MSNRVDDASGRFKPRLSLRPVSPPSQLSFQDTDLHPACANQHIFQLVSDHNCNSYLSPFFEALLLPKRACSDTTLMHFEKNTPALRFWIIYRSGVVYPRQSN